MLEGHQRNSGVFVSRESLRESIRRVKVNIRPQPYQLIRRREYSVKAPLTMWHIDGHHKLIRWRFVVHGGIDEFSRVVVFLFVATDNRASTVLLSFIHGVKTWGLPSTVRLVALQHRQVFKAFL